MLVERSVNSLVALLGMLLLGGSGCKLPQKEIFISGVAQMFAMASSNEALRFVSYPTQVLGKSCKMVPVMLGGAVLDGKTYSVFEYVQVVLITAGVTAFNFGGKKKGGGADSTYGLGLIGFSLFLDAVTAGLQDKVKSKTKELNKATEGARPTMHESMFYTNFAGALTALVLAGALGQLQEGLSFCLEQPELMKALVIYSLASAVGQNFIYFTITNFGPLTVTTVTTTRKIFSTLYSVFRDPNNSLDEMQWGGCSLVFLGLLGDVVSKMGKKDPKKDEKKKK